MRALVRAQRFRRHALPVQDLAEVEQGLWIDRLQLERTVESLFGFGELTRGAIGHAEVTEVQRVAPIELHGAQRVFHRGLRRAALQRHDDERVPGGMGARIFLQDAAKNLFGRLQLPALHGG